MESLTGTWWLIRFDRLADKAGKAAGAVVKDKGAVA
jgi:hypothetical protein